MMRAAESVPSRPASRSAPIVRYEAREHYPIALLGGGSCPSLPVPRYALVRRSFGAKNFPLEVRERLPRRVLVRTLDPARTVEFDVERNF
jgi:hypothetical protein